MSRTASENDDGGNAKPVGLLTYVLCYDDLLAADAIALPAFGRDVFAIELQRCDETPEVRVAAGRFLLADPYVSSHHACIQRRGVIDVVQDLRSRHGTFVNGERLPEGGERALRDGDLVEVGHSLLSYRLMDAALVHEGAPIALGPTPTFSPEVIRLVKDLEQVALTEQAVLLLGEPGTGKEVAARHIHEKSGRRGPFVAVDCGAIPEQLIESELFGHRRGAFTGATEERKGRIRSADKGTVFLDEIGNMSEGAQARLLRAIQVKEVVPIGSDKGQKVNVRWVSATNADLFSGNIRFRQDLRDRLSGCSRTLPPLRCRREDLGILSAYILENANARTRSITKRAGRLFFSGVFPGNVRELENTLRHAATLAGESPIDLEHLPIAQSATIPPETQKVGRHEDDDSSSGEKVALLSTRHRRPSKDTIEKAIEKANGVQGEAARILGIHERQLARWMDALGIPRARSRR